jgi:dATP pyrophosphohydrolase
LRRPESVLVIVHTHDARVLLLKRKTPFAFWQSVTGSLDPGESPAECARRELVEETGLDPGDRLVDTGISRVFTIDPRWLHRYPPGTSENREYEWRLALDEPVDVRIDVEEHSAWRWADIDQAIESVWSWTNREALEALRADLRGDS